MAGNRNPSGRHSTAASGRKTALKSSAAASSTRARATDTNGSSNGSHAKVTSEIKLELLKLLLKARMNDEAEQALKRRGQGHFQMSCEGHEALGAMALAMKQGDWLHPHYRDRAIVMGRGITHEDIFLDYYSKASGPSAGRQMPEHYNSRRHRIVSLSSPVATNLLQAVGMAMSLKERKIPEVVVASIGDASTREGESLEAFAQAGVDNLPIVFLIEDNRYGISTPTEGKTFWTMPHGLATAQDGSQWFYGCKVDLVDGLDPIAVYQKSLGALERARSGQGATCLVARVERLKSHSSSDDQRIYRSPQELAAAAARDPVKQYVNRCVKEGLITQAELDKIKEDIQAEIDAALERARSAPEPDPTSIKGTAFAKLPDDLPTKEQYLPQYLSKKSGGLTMAQCIDLTLEQEMRRSDRICLFGEDIEDPKGDVFGTTRGLSKQFPGRVKNSPLAEATIVGSGVGRAIMGDVPVAAIQFIDFMGPGLNQLFNEVVTLYWRSMGQWNCHMIMTAPYGAYLPGLGPWHSQTNEAIYAHLPGLHIVIPSSPGDAAGLLRYALRCNRPVLYLYPKALLHSAEDTVEEPSTDCIVPFGQARIVREGRDVTMVTWGNCVNLCRSAAAQAAKEGIEAEIVDLRTIIPWDIKTVLQSVVKTGRLLVVHEDAKTGGFGAEIISEIVGTSFEQLRAVPMRVTKSDDHNPYHYNLELAILPSADGILKALRELQRQDLRPGRRAFDSHVGIGVGAAAASEPVISQPAPVASMYEIEEETSTPTTASAAVASGPGTVDIMVPRQSPTDEDATVVKYLVQVGQKVKTGTPLVEMEANKGSFEVESTHDGVVKALNSKPGERVHVESTSLVTLDVEGAPSRAAESARTKAPQRAIVLPPSQLQVGALALKSQHEIPTVSVECEVDLTEVWNQREKLKKEFDSKHGVKATYTQFILWSMVHAMLDPKNEGFRGRLTPAADRLLIDENVNVGFAAVGPGESLYSPVIKKANALKFPEFAKRMQELTEKVRAGQVQAADLQGATVTLTNIGAFEATSGTPFIIPGQLAMLTAGSILERPRFAAGADGKRQLEPRRLLNLKLVFDHRPFNGSHAASFLRTIKHTLEELKLQELL
ncbi:MAG TPA: thiamine pyrophosphate-dependent enzyme [Planctomycetota bacterium]|nr:thiamine pyrophosphate-dependent enzyme [Planctomycetota bacterium]